MRRSVAKTPVEHDIPLEAGQIIQNVTQTVLLVLRQRSGPGRGVGERRNRVMLLWQ